MERDTGKGWWREGVGFRYGENERGGVETWQRVGTVTLDKLFHAIFQKRINVPN